MSIAVLNQVYDEARRLAVAGSVVARGDFRLKKLLPPLEQAGAKAPVFAKVAECAKAVIDGPEEKSAETLLELTSLVTAVLYTQGETAAPGDLRPIESVDLGGSAAQTSARLLKPLLEALTNTGSGRLELIRDAHDRGAFRDLRLVRPALNGLDDPYPEIADYIAERVLPMYGAAILPELRAKYDPKGTKGHPRRLKLMHALDPAGTRELVKQALESGSKEVKVAAISCLGADREDLPFLIEQAAAKAQDVRGAAYHALALLNDPAAAAVLEKAITGKDYELASSAIQEGKNEKLTGLIVAEVRKGVADLIGLKDKKKVSEAARRLSHLVRALPGGEHKAADALTLDLFARRSEVAKAKGDSFSGSDVVEAVIQRMVSGPKGLQTTLARAHAELEADDLASAFEAARQALTPAEVYDTFAPYLEAEKSTPYLDSKKGAKKKNLDTAKRDAVIDALDGDHIYYHRGLADNSPPLDPRWIDLAVRIKHLGLVSSIGKPGYKSAETFIRSEFDAAAKTPRNADKVRELLWVMVHLEHPDATDAFISTFEKSLGKANHYSYWYTHMIPDLPKSAVPRLEAIVPKLKDREADQWLEAIQELRTKA